MPRPTATRTEEATRLQTGCAFRPKVTITLAIQQPIKALLPFRQRAPEQAPVFPLCVISRHGQFVFSLKPDPRAPGRMTCASDSLAIDMDLTQCGADPGRLQRIGAQL